MMVTIFGTALLALVLGQIGWRQWALACLTLCLGLSLYLFLFEVYSNEYGFAMPWLQL
ncbi:hypothetical protein [Aestuariivirga sp.]|uniref:hypothetical protein n=1 Tax=Aestuariivirga sp. TaxID=2650926 RepID=UPI0039E4039D